jgi:hypothetical protein
MLQREKTKVFIHPAHQVPTRNTSATKVFHQFYIYTFAIFSYSMYEKLLDFQEQKVPKELSLLKMEAFHTKNINGNEKFGASRCQNTDLPMLHSQIFSLSELCLNRRPHRLRMLPK